ncbi:MAG: hypothetical protein Q8P27_00120, partial [Candidatus Peregrinibacteria bacterium]|nr:hypothetical protein [Candidatus Peregrinibacteria bacterium]
MTFKIDHEFLLIGKESSGFTKNYFYEWDDGLGGCNTQLFLNLTFKGEEILGEDLGDAIFDTMKNYFFHELDRDANDRFEDTLKEVNHLVQEKEKKVGESLVGKIDAISAVISADTLFLSQRGNAEAYLARRRFVSDLTEGLCDPKNQEELFSNIASGELVSGDSVLLSSTRLLRYITKADLGRLMSEEPKLGRALDAIGDAVSLDLMEQVNVLGVHVGEEMVLVIEGEEKDVMPVHTSGLSFGKVTSVLKMHFEKLRFKKKTKGEKSEIRDVEENVVVDEVIYEQQGECMHASGHEMEVHHVESQQTSTASKAHEISSQEQVKSEPVLEGTPSSFSVLIHEWRELK